MPKEAWILQTPIAVQEGTVRVVQLSDPHLDLGTRAKRLSHVVIGITAAERPDLLMITGDLTEHVKAAQYRQLFSLLPHDIPHLVVPGNHDDPRGLSSFVSENHSSCIVRRAGHVTAAGLDTSIRDQDFGRLTREGISRAEETLQNTDGPVLLAFHHPPIRVGQEHIDALRLENPDDLRDFITRYPNIIATMCGHTHLAYTSTVAGKPLIGAPGIASTLRLNNDRLALDETAPPGYVVQTITDDILISSTHIVTMKHKSKP